MGEIPGGIVSRTVYAWHTPNKQSTSVSVVSTITSVEFTALGSFGTPYGFALTNVARLDRRSRKREKQIADLVGAGRGPAAPLSCRPVEAEREEAAAAAKDLRAAAAEAQAAPPGGSGNGARVSGGWGAVRCQQLSDH